MRVLVMGGTQFNGLALVHELAGAGHEVTIVNRGQTKADIPEGVRRLFADRTNHDQMREVLRHEEFDCVQDMSAYHPEDVQLMLELFGGRVGHYIFASSTVTYAASDALPITEAFPDDRGPAQNEYGLHKLLCEDILLQAHAQDGFPATSVPFSMVMGPRNIVPDREQRMFMRMLLRRKVLVPGDGQTLLQVGDVSDQAVALRMMMLNPVTFGKRYNLTGKQQYTRNGYVDTIAQVLGMEADKLSIPHDLMDRLWAGDVLVELGQATGTHIDIRSSDADRTERERARAAQMWRLGGLIQTLAPNIHGWNRNTYFSIDRLRHDVGWEPRHTLETMVERTYEWFLAEGLNRTSQFDWTFEDQLIELVERGG